MSRYRTWTAALEEHFFRGDSRDRVYLAIDDEQLEAIAEATERSLPSARFVDATREFVDAVLEEVEQVGWNPESDSTGRDCLARCCLFVLAYSRIPSKGRQGAPSFVQSLRELVSSYCHELDRGPSKDWLPGLDQSTFQAIWDRLEQSCPEVELPPRAPSSERNQAGDPWAGQHCNLRLLQSQAGLRRLDLDRIRGLFDERRDKEMDASADSLLGFVRSRESALPEYAREVLEERPEIGKGQIFAEWRRWQQAPSRPSPPSPSRRDPAEAAADLFFEVDEAERELRCFRGPERLSEDAILEEVRRARRRALLGIFDSLQHGFRVARRAERRDEVLLVGRRAGLESAEEDLRGIASGDPQRLGGFEGLLPTLLAWRLTLADGVAEAQNPWAWILPPRIRFEGGLALDRRARCWLRRAGPTIVVEGPSEVRLDGLSVGLDEGTLSVQTLECGLHVIAAGRVSERFEIARPRRAEPPDPRPWVWGLDHRAWPNSGVWGAKGERPLATLEGPRFSGRGLFQRRYPEVLEQVVRLRHGLDVKVEELSRPLKGLAGRVLASRVARRSR